MRSSKSNDPTKHIFIFLFSILAADVLIANSTSLPISGPTNSSLQFSSFVYLVRPSLSNSAVRLFKWSVWMVYTGVLRSWSASCLYRSVLWFDWSRMKSLASSFLILPHEKDTWEGIKRGQPQSMSQEMNDCIGMNKLIILCIILLLNIRLCHLPCTFQYKQFVINIPYNWFNKQYRYSWWASFQICSCSSWIVCCTLIIFGVLTTSSM